ncbi:MAG: hypothetical protein JNM07_13065 [Phycisphaerae bacterium]|nr:hypothetical protein [Phycisphaerae bacterium]
MNTAASHSIRGVTLIEVVLAAALLGTLAVTVGALLAHMQGARTREDQRLGAYELANRKVLEYLDDRKAVGDDNLPQEYDRWRYRWSISEEPVELVARAPAAAPSTAAASRSAAIASQHPDRFRLLTVSVWAVDETAAARSSAPRGELLAQIARVYDPLNLSRNPDAAGRLMDDKQELQRRLFDSGIGPAPGAKGSPPPPPPPSRGTRGSKP